VERLQTERSVCDWFETSHGDPGVGRPDFQPARVRRDLDRGYPRRDLARKGRALQPLREQGATRARNVRLRVRASRGVLLGGARGLRIGLAARACVHRRLRALLQPAGGRGRLPGGERLRRSRRRATVFARPGSECVQGDARDGAAQPLARGGEGADRARGRLRTRGGFYRCRARRRRGAFTRLEGLAT